MTIKFYFCSILISILISFGFNNFAQENPSIDSIIIIPNSNYYKSSFNSVFFGAHWRDVWTTAVKVKVLNLKEFAGGLTPLKEGGGKQTKSLHLIDSTSRRWKFRSIDKDPSKVLPDYLRESIAEDILQDQISSANPYAPLIIPKLLEAVKVNQVSPELVLMPDDTLLGAYKNKFGGVLGFIEPHTNESFIDDIEVEGAVKVEDTFSAIKEIEKNFNQKFAAEEYLKARLIDILVGDWDRHMDQWRWIKVEDLSNVKWLPIPRDRDQAFVKFDGILPSIAAYYTPQLNHFGDDYPSIKDLTWNGRFLDNRVLTYLNKNIWDSVTTFVHSKITDEVIEDAVKTLPPEVYSIAKDEITVKLKHRRDKLFEASNEFYNVVNKYADIFCSRQDDFVEVVRVNNTSTSVKVYNRNEFISKLVPKPYFNKIFNYNITDEIRIYLNDGDDKTIVSGIVDEGPVMRVIGGDGKDELIDESIVKGNFLSITPFSSAETKTYFYDSGKKTKIKYSNGTIYDDTKFVESDDVVEKYQPTPIDKDHLWFPLPIIGFESNSGVTIGASVQRIQYSFRQVPYKNQQTLSAFYSTGFKKFTFTYNADFYDITKNSFLNILLSGTEQFITRYYGYGNESVSSKELENIDYYNVDQQLRIIRPTFNYIFSTDITAGFGLSLLQTETAVANDSLLNTARYGEYGINELNFFSVNVGLKIDNITNTHYPLSGYTVRIYAQIYPKVFKDTDNFSSVEADLKYFYQLKNLDDLVIGFRAGGKKLWGQYPFFASANLGGRENLRGYPIKRFSGDASLFGQLELRKELMDLKLILKSKLGLLTFMESGRVFAVNESSKKWHSSYGIGAFLSYLNSSLVLNTYVAFSPDDTIFSFGFDLPF